MAGRDDDAPLRHREADDSGSNSSTTEVNANKRSAATPVHPTPSPTTASDANPRTTSEQLKATALTMPAFVTGELGLRLGVHDLSRLEWTVSVPMPQDGTFKYDVLLFAELPAAMYVPHNQWDALQSYTRLQSPIEDAGPELIDCLDLDELRRDTLGIAHLLKLKRQKFERAAAGAAAHLVSALDPALPRTLSALIAEAVKLVDDVRNALEAQRQKRSGDPRSREWMLVDEFLSHQLLEFFARCQRAVSASLLAVSSRLHDVGTEFTSTLTSELEHALKREMEHRREHGFVVPAKDSGEGVAVYVERAAQLKRHFEDVLFLEGKRYMVGSRAGIITGIMAACVAGVLYTLFSLMPASSRAGLSVGTFVMLFAIAYALRDFIKEQTRAWLVTRLVQMYGQRTSKFWLPENLDREKTEVLVGHERFSSTESEQADVLNHTVGATRQVMTMKYRLSATLHKAQAARQKGLSRVKHIFRYDFAPLLSRLDSGRRRVPVLCSEGEVSFVEAPKEYRIPLRLEVRLRGHGDKLLRATGGELVISRRGIERLEPSRSDTP